MPRINKADNAKKGGKLSKKEAPQEVMNNDSNASEDSSIVMDNSPEASDPGKIIGEENGFEKDFTGEMSKLLERFSSDMNKTMQAKRRKLEHFTQESTRSTARKVLETNKNQSTERRMLIDHFQNQLNVILEQGETELEKIKKEEERMQKLFLQQQKNQQVMRTQYGQQMKALKNLSAEFCKGMGELEESHVEQYMTVHNDLRKEMALLQKKILMETQQQEMMNVRKHLKQMFS